MTSISTFLGKKVGEIRKRSRGMASALKNHHLAEVTATALELVIRDSPELTKHCPDFATVARKHWLDLLEQGDPRIDSFKEDELDERMTVLLSEKQAGEPTGERMLAYQWIAILKEVNVQLPAGERMDRHSLQQLAAHLVAKFPDRIYRAFKQDAADGGEAFGGVVMRMLASIRTDIRELQAGVPAGAVDDGLCKWLDDVSGRIDENSRKIDGVRDAVETSREDLKAHVSAENDALDQKLAIRLDNLEALFKEHADKSPPEIPPAVPHVAAVTTLWMPPARPNPLFCGRDRELDAIRKCRDELRSSRVVLCGAPGIGKTALAIQWCASVDPKPSRVLWIDCLSPQTIDDSLRALVGSGAAAGGAAEPTPHMLEQALRVAIDSLQREQDWVLIADRCDTEESLVAFRSRFSAITQGYVIVTSRLRSWPAEDLPFEVDELAVEHASTLLFRQTGGTTKEPAADARIVADRLVVELGCLPLAIVESANLIRQRAISPADYEQMLLAKRREFSAAAPDAGTAARSGLTATYAIAFEERSGDAMGLLTCFSFLDCENIPRRFINHYESFVRAHLPESASIEGFLFELRDHSLAEIGADGIIRVNRILRDVLRELCPREQYLLMLGVAALLCANFEWNSRKEAEPHFRRISEQLFLVPLEQQSDKLCVFGAMFQITFADLLHKRWKMADAVQVAQSAFRTIGSRPTVFFDYISKDATGLILVHRLGELFKRYHCMAEAGQCFRWAEEAFRALPNPSTPEILDHHLGVGIRFISRLVEAGEYDRAATLAQSQIGRVQTLRAELPDNRDLLVLEFLAERSLGDVYHGKEDWIPACAAYRRSWELLMSCANHEATPEQKHSIMIGGLMRMAGAVYRVEGKKSSALAIRTGLEEARRNNFLDQAGVKKPAWIKSLTISNEKSEFIQGFLTGEIASACSRLDPGNKSLRKMAIFFRGVQMLASARRHAVVKFAGRGFEAMLKPVLKLFFAVATRVTKNEQVKELFTFRGQAKAMRAYGDEELADMYEEADRRSPKGWY
ncbi:ATP-binding protein [Luteolibacter arcticus]|uniref:ATP-binding protein n=1 Tax=Luteolibacter arcticus TaxID=1581411 RepID=UPI0022218E9D|nr:ATP-binding protein [Luteolibacter arcticus]